ncbi:MAG: hypothetical protein ACYC61_00360 [Isosphaeraceae bacterium]
MMGFLASAAAWLSAGASLLGRYLLAPVAFLPGWLSATAIGAVTGVLLLAVFKHTSNQRAIHRVRNDIDAHLLALKLFRDSAAVALRAQARVIAGATRLLLLAVVPMLVMAIPVTLVLGQMSLWYEARPLRVGEESVVTLALAGDASAPWPSVNLRPTNAVDVEAGPVRVRDRREVCWNLRAREPGSHRLEFQVGGQAVAKELAIGDGFMRVSLERPGWDWSSILLYPWESPFRPGDAVRSIAVAYPERSSWIYGSGTWVISWFVVSFVVALGFRRALNVKI